VTVIAAARVLGADIPDDEPGWVEIDDGRVVATGLGCPRGARYVDDAVLAPGYIDLQVNGFATTDFATATAEDCVALVDGLRGHGVTACCPTLVTAPLDAYDDALARLAVAAKASPAIVGVHLEGPFLGGAPGAHDVALVRPVDLTWLRSTLDRWPGLVRVVTLAPEADPGFEAVRLLSERGVTVALGHSTVAYDDARAAASAGATLVTHLFNGMGPLHHRAPGLAGAALDDPRLVPSLIADFVHVHPALVRVAATVRPDLVLVSDAVAVDDRAVHEANGAAYLADGTLAGSTLTMERAVQNMAAAGVPLAAAVAMATANPARVLGLEDRGRLEPGARAEVIALSRERLQVSALDALPGW
jgi:N-acetylglucosamine-6-phosphate deacetylase